eukprot:scaffold28076_cov52-Cyclotella_meneghiniana.AAC.5
MASWETARWVSRGITAIKVVQVLRHRRGSGWICRSPGSQDLISRSRKSPLSHSHGKRSHELDALWASESVDEEV